MNGFTQGMSQNAAHIAQRGDEIVSQMVTVMGSIDESSKKISEISSIAFQTNILALNASLEDQARQLAQLVQVFRIH